MKLRVVICCLAMSLVCSVATAQGLIWSLPEDGTLVRYRGSYTQTIRRPNVPEGDLTLTWDRILEIRSVGREEAEFAGETQPCRWIEIKVETGKSPEGVLDAGPGGTRLFKLLIPEKTVWGAPLQPVTADRSVYASHFPLVRGYRKIGDEPTQELETDLFHLYPIVSLLRHYHSIVSGEAANVAVLAGEFTGTQLTGSIQMESNVYRSTNIAEMVRSDEFPFGLVSWKARSLIEEKGSTDPRSDFSETTVIEEEMTAIAIERDAESELLVD